MQLGRLIDSRTVTDRRYGFPQHYGRFVGVLFPVFSLWLPLPLAVSSRMAP